VANTADLSKHWLKGQRKVQKRIDRVQRENEGWAECRTWASINLSGSLFGS
jgi:hypothetical protein